MAIILQFKKKNYFVTLAYNRRGGEGIDSTIIVRLKSIIREKKLKLLHRLHQKKGYLSPKRKIYTNFY